MSCFTDTSVFKIMCRQVLLTHFDKPEDTDAKGIVLNNIKGCEPKIDPMRPAGAWVLLNRLQGSHSLPKGVVGYIETAADAEDDGKNGHGSLTLPTVPGKNHVHQKEATTRYHTQKSPSAVNQNKAVGDQRSTKNSQQ